jgi:hypothetical protein
VGKFRTSEIISYLEEKLADNMATEDEEQLYSDYKWSGKVNKNTYGWRNLIMEMRDINDNGYN